MFDDIPTHDDLVEVAHLVINDGVQGGQLNPFDPMAQVLVAGANVILAATDAGLTPEDVFNLIRDNARTTAYGEAGGF